MKEKIFFTVCFGFIFGVLARSMFFIDFHLALFLSVMSLAFFFFFKFVSKHDIGILISVLMLLFSFGTIRFHFSNIAPPLLFESKLDQEVVLMGKIIDEPDIRENNKKVLFEAKEDGYKVRVLITADFCLDLRYGDEITVRGVLEKPENFITDQGKEFDYVNYLRKDEIFYLMRYVDVEVLSSGHGNFLKVFLFSIKEKFSSKINLAVREPESLLLGGLILGEKSAFSDSLRKNFVDTGTIHIVSLSGYNITIIAEWIMKVFSVFPQTFAIGAGILSILLFILMTGGASTAIRAGIMAVLALYARASGRNYDVARALLLAGVVMTLINPFVLYYDVSFQLSFLATIAVIFFAPRVEKYFQWITKSFGLRDIISVTSAVYIFVLPFILYKMGNLSLVALPANIFILPFIPITMGIGFLTGFAGLFSYFLSVPFGYLSYQLLHYELAVVDFFARVPFASLSIPDFPLVLTVLIYACFAYKLFGRDIKESFTSPR